MKTLLPRVLTCATALFAMSPNLYAEKIPDGAAEKITLAIPDQSYAKPEKPRRLLVFSRTKHGADKICRRESPQITDAGGGQRIRCWMREAGR